MRSLWARSKALETTSVFSSSLSLLYIRNSCKTETLLHRDYVFSTATLTSSDDFWSKVRISFILRLCFSRLTSYSRLLLFWSDTDPFCLVQRCLLIFQNLWHLFEDWRKNGDHSNISKSRLLFTPMHRLFSNLLLKSPALGIFYRSWRQRAAKTPSHEKRDRKSASHRHNVR